jgi:hypothetical protein
MKQITYIMVSIFINILALFLSDFISSLIEDWSKVLIDNLFPFSGTWRSKKLQRHQMVLVKRILLLFAGPCKTNIFSLLLTL